MVKRKGQDMLVKAWPAVVARFPEARLLLVGDGPDRARVERLAARADVLSSVIFTGSLPWSEVPKYVDAADVFAMPCRTRLLGLEPEAFGIVFLEAAACGLPLIVGNSGGATETVKNGETGYVVASHDVTALAIRVCALIENMEHAREMGRLGRAWVTGRWAWESTLDSLKAALS